MKKKLSLLIFFLSTVLVFSQENSFWQKQAPASISDIKTSRQNLPKNETFSLNIEALKAALKDAPERGTFSGNSNLIISFPNAEGEFERFRVMEASVMHADLAAKYPNIKSYAGQGVEDPSARIRFSISPLGLQSMRLSSFKDASFIEPYTNDLSQYTVYKRQDKAANFDNFECEVTDAATRSMTGAGVMRNADDGILRTYRLAVSATGEYTQYHGGTKALALAAMNTTMTRVNGIYESDFNVTLILIANTDDVIYTSTSSDPYGNTTSGYNSQLQSTLTSVIGEANYDIGHLFANLQNNGNAGCIGCVCVNGQKGSGWTSHVVPEGDPFDVDYVAHEMGHQFGGNHTWTHGGNEGTGVQMEPGSGSTIMGYAGITGATDVQSNSDPYFHAASIEQITDYIKSTSCQTNTNTGNAIPTANAGANYTIPKGTPFVLTGTGTDANSGDVLTYCWEQMNNGSSSTTNPNPNATSGPAFRSFNPTTETNRYFPRLETIKTGATSWQWEAVPNVARTMNFRMTVRDNKAGGGANNSDDTVITVNGTAGPFVLNSPNTNVTWDAGTTQTITWNVAGTTSNGVNAANVDIFLSTDGGDTYAISLANGVPNDGSHDIVVPNNQGNQNRIMVKGSNHVFFDISNSNFTIGAPVVCNATTPTGLTASNIGSSGATLSWDAVPGATYDLRYRVAGTTTWTTNAITGVSSSLSGLATLTQYETQVRSKCTGGSNSAYSNSVNFTTTDVQVNYCASQSSNVNDEYISRVQLGSIDNASGAQFYSDFTGVSTNLTQGTQYTVTVTPTWTGTLYNEGYAVWVDYNKDGDFTDAGEQVFSQSPTQATPVSGNFTVPLGTVIGSTRMRVTMSYNAIPTSCQSFTYGEVEDYTINLSAGVPDTTAPVITLIGASTINLDVGDIYNELGATATDNIDGDISANVVITGTVDTNTAGTYTRNYNVSDAAGNPASQVSRTIVVTQPADTTPPVITLVGASTINLTVGDAYTELGATATDNIDGNLTANIVITGSVNTAVAGTYNINYNVSDAAGNAATQVVRTINVNEPSTGCSAGISTFPYNEGFENTLGAWSQSTADDIDWTVDANGTPSNNTGPASASQGTYYIYVEASGNGTGFPNKQAILNSPCFDLSGETSAIFSFKYHQFGATDMGSINLEASADDGASWSSIWNSSGNLGNSWQTANVDLAAYTGGSVQLRFNRITGSTWQADIAIDDVSLTDGTVTGCSGGISSFPYTESYESSIGAWSQSGADDINWTRDSGGTPSNGTGPSTGANGSFYMYVEASGNGTGYPNKRAILNSPCIDLSGQSTANFGFSYHMYGAADMGSISLEASPDNGASWTSIWSETGNKGNSWFSVNIDLSAYVGGSVQLRFNRLTGSTWQADIAVDNISLTSASRARQDELTDGAALTDLSIYPNPVKGSFLNVKTTSQNLKYQIYNMIGQTVAKGSLSQNRIDVSNLDTAVYVIEFNGGDEKVVKRFIKE